MARSVTAKYKMEEWCATGLYPARASSILASVSSLICCFSEISSDSSLEDCAEEGRGREGVRVQCVCK